MTGPTVVIDGIQLTGQSSRSGIGTYVRELVNGLASLDEIDLSVLATHEAPLPDSVARLTVRRRWRHGRRSEWEHELLRPIALMRNRADVYHSPNFVVSALQRSPWVATLYDLAPLVVQDDPNLLHLRSHMLRFGRRLARADAVVAISRFAADAGIGELGLDPRRVHVCHLGVAREFTPDGPVPTADPPYLLLVSEYQRRKGFDRAFAVIDALAEARYPHVLKVAGRVNPWVQDELAAMAAATSHPDRVQMLGFADDLPGLYRGATVTLIPSRYEGFGLPALEAMASGCPVVSFDNSALGEIVGEGGLLAPEGDVKAMTKLVMGLLDDPRRHAEQSEAGRAWASRFSWEACAALHAEIYRSVAGR